jgi:hypothetical protein
MSLLLLIGLITLSEIVFGFLYGFWLQNVIPYELLLSVAYSLPFTLLLIFWKNRRDKTVVKIVEIAVLSLLLCIVAPLTYDEGNHLCAEMTAQYDVVVESVYGHGGGRAEFTTPDGCSAEVELHDYRVVLTDDYVEVGDTIRVQEYRGLFKQPYYVFVEEIQK